jgi:ParB family chromosome partitioning protein
MSKLDDLRRVAGGNAAESMGTPRVTPMHGASSLVAPDRMQGITRSKNAAEIPHDRISPDPDQPREEFDPEALSRLAESLKTRGQLQPIRVRWDEGRGSYVIICGERRWRAAGLAGLQTMQCTISDITPDAGQLLELQLIENCVREDLRPVEQARAFRQLIDRNGWSTRQVARELGIDQSGVSRALALLNLPVPVQERVESGEIAASVAYEVSKLEDPAKQSEVAAIAIAEGLNRAEVVRVVRERSAKPAKGRGAKAKARKTSATIRAANGARVTVEHRKGLDDDVILSALADALAQLRNRQESRGEAA